MTFYTHQQIIFLNILALAMMAGLCSLRGGEVANYGEEFVINSRIKKAFQDQEAIGWSHFARGRMARTWSLINQPSGDAATVQMDLAKVAIAMIEYGVTLWIQRNSLVHGNDSGISKLETRKMQQMITAIYEEIRPTVEPSNQWLFHCSEEVRIGEPYALQVAWVDSVRRLYPSRFDALKEKLGTRAYRRTEVQYQKEHGAQTLL